MYPRVGEKRSIDDINIEDEEAVGTLCRLSGSGRPESPKAVMEQEKRIRREIANSNERRRMQSINAGFASLKTLLPHHEGEKLSKAAILQQTAEYIYQLEQEKTRLLSQNSQLKRLLNQQHVSDPEGSPTGTESPNEDRTAYDATPPPTSGTTTTQISANGKIDEIALSDIGAVESRVFVDREGKYRLKINSGDQVRVMETEVYTEAVKNSQHIKIYQPQETTVKIEVKHEDLRQTTLSPMTELSPMAVDQQEVYMEDIHIQKPMNKVVTTRMPLGTMTTTSKVVTTAPMRVNHPTIVTTVMPPPKGPTKTVLEVDAVDMEGNYPTIISESIDENVPQLGNHTVFIVNSPGTGNSSSPCQKSLDTICEAIRHLEGDHMFPSQAQQPISRIEEEVVTEETYTVEEGHHNSGGQIIYTEKSDDSMNHLTLHMIEPQEVPLELTTSHRDVDLHQYSMAQQTPGPILQRHSSRPGVIVVKHS